MKVILNKDVPSIGEEGDIKDVARGYARNFLIPKKLVMPYSAQSLAILESRKETIAQRRAEKAKNALDIKARLEAEPLTIEMPAGERGRLFGSVTSANIVDALAAQGITVERKRIEIPEKTIKSVGTSRVRIRLYGEEEAELKVIVSAVGGSEEAGSDTTAPASAAETQEEASPAGAAPSEEAASDDVVVAEAPAADEPTEEAVADVEEPAADE